MALYFLEYDLRKQRNYKPLYDALATFGAVHILESLWCFKRDNTSTVGLRDYFRTLIDNDDGIIVSQVSDWASFNVRALPSQLK
ncbi:hypothetical protein SAMN05428951_113121 [Pseudomonas sp. OV546]|nr:hypothetical protein SAMN05428951_113121 [Pseudomonas sp. OV546]